MAEGTPQRMATGPDDGDLRRYHGNSAARAGRLAVPGFACAALVGWVLSAPAAAQEVRPDDGGTSASGTASGAAIDWSLSGRVRYGIDGDINRDLDTSGQGALLTQALDAGLILDAETKRALFSAELGVAARYFIGDDDDLNGTGRLDPSINLRHAYQGKTYQIDTRAGLVVTRAAFSQVEDTGTTDANTSQFTVTYGTGLTQQLDPENTLTLSLNGSLIDFSEDVPDLVPTFTTGVNAAWARQLTETSTVTFDLGFRHFAAENAEDTRSQTVDLGARLEHRRTSRHTFGLGLGVSGVRTTETGVDTDFDIGLTGGVSLDYTLRSLSTNLSLDQSIEPSSEGQLESFTRVNGGIGYRLNSRQRSDLGLAYTRRTPLNGGDTRDLLNLNSRYSIALTRALDLTLAYTFRLSRDDTDGTAMGHQVSAVLEQRFDLVP